MPIYEYECPKCGHFEVMQKASDKPLKCDPDCKEKNCPKKAERLISASAFHLKGTGWYKTDYAKSGSSGSSKSSSSKKDSSTSSKSDSSSSSSGGDSSSGSSGDSGDSGKKAKGCGSGCGCH